MLVHGFRLPEEGWHGVFLKHWGNPKYPPFGGPPLFYKAPSRISASKMQIDTLQNVNWAGEISVSFFIEIADWRSPIPFWRVPTYFWRPRLSWGCFTDKGGLPQKANTLVPTQEPKLGTILLQCCPKVIVHCGTLEPLRSNLHCL